MVSLASGAVTSVTQTSNVVNQNAGTVTITFAITSAVAEGGTVAVTFEDYTTISGTPTATLGGSGGPTYTATHSGTAANTLTYTITSSDLGGMVISDGPYVLTITGGSDIVNPQVAGNDVTITLVTSAPETMADYDITIIPVVTSIDPANRGAGSATTSYTITGYGFGNGEILAGGVTVGGQASTGVTYSSVTTITATGVDVSSLGAGTYDVVVTNNGATGTGSNIFTINAAPAFVSAATNTAGTTITITFSRAMADPAGKHGEFTYSINGGAAQAFSAAALNADTTKIDLTTAGTAIAFGDVVTVSYTAGTVTAADTGVLATFADQAVTNNKAAPPTVASAATDVTGATITITFSKAMADPAGKHGQFFYQIGGGADQAFSAAALNADTTKIDLTTAGTAIANGDVVTVKYTAGTVTAADTGVLATFAGQAVTNNVPVPAPTVASAATDVTGATITITFSKAMADPAGKHGEFTYSVNGGAAQAFSAAALNADTTKIDLTTAGTAIVTGDVVTVSYTAGTVTAADTGVLASFAGQAVTNNMATVPVAGFTGTPTSGASPLSVTFTDTSTNTPTSWLWDFGDGTTSTVQNPVHAYSEGTYTVSLTATNAAGSNTATKTGYISVSAAIPAPVYSSPSTSDSDSYASSSASGGPVAGTSAPTSTGETVVLTFDQGVSPTNAVGISQIQIVPNQNIGGFQMIAQAVDLGTALQVQGGPVAGYLQIQMVGMNPTVIDHATIVFEVSGSWLASHNLNPADVSLMRYVDDQWVELPTAFSHKDGDNYYFSATTPGFSYFAITARQSTDVPDIPDEPETMVGTSKTPVQTFGDLAGPGSSDSPSSKVAVITQATPVPPPVNPPAPNEPSYLPVLVILVCIVVVAGAFIAWRWRQKQENPLLFEK